MKELGRTPTDLATLLTQYWHRYVSPGLNCGINLAIYYPYKNALQEKE
jgi:hypothetical protein